jgi:hypothetical protein
VTKMHFADAVTLDSRQQQFAATLVNACSNTLNRGNKNPASGASICRVIRTDHEHGQTFEGMHWPAPGEEPVDRITMLDNITGANSTVQRWAREKQGKIRAGI